MSTESSDPEESYELPDEFKPYFDFEGEMLEGVYLSLSEERSEEERRYIRTAVFDYMTTLQMEAQFNEDPEGPDQQDN